MDTPEVAVARYAARISFWALGVSGGSLVVTAALLALEVRRWFDEGVKLYMSVMAEAQIFGGGQQDENDYLAITVTNRGSAPTTITNMVLFDYPSWISMKFSWVRRFKRQRPKTMVVTRPMLPGVPGQPPYVLEPGHNWQGMAVHTPELKQMIEAGRLHVGVFGSHSDKPLLRQVRKWRPPEDAKKA